MGVKIARLMTQDFMQMEPPEIMAYLQRWGNVLATVEYPWLRFIFSARTMSLQQAVNYVAKLKKRSKHQTRQQFLESYRRMLQALSSSSILAHEHYIIVPVTDENAHGRSERLLDTLTVGLGLPYAVEESIPSPIPERTYYEDPKGGMLVPFTPVGQMRTLPLATILRSYVIEGQWTWNVLAELLYVGFPLDISVYFTRVSDPLAELDNAKKRSLGILKSIGAKGQLDQYNANLNALEKIVIQNREGLHMVGIAVLVQGKNKAELDNRIQVIRSRTAGRVRWQRPIGDQARTVRMYWGVSGNILHPPSKILHNVPSLGVAYIIGGPLGIRARTSTRGVLWGVSDGQPFFWDGFGWMPGEERPKDLTANHLVIVGKTGSGKTVTMNAIALREINLRGTQVIMLEPFGHSRRVYEALGGNERASYNPLRLSEVQINPLDCVYDDIRDQSAHIQLQIHMLLSRPGYPRPLNNLERAAIDAAVRVLYERVKPETPPYQQPRLEHLVRFLRSRNDGGVSEQLADEIDGLFVSGSLASTFNVPTTFDLRLKGDYIAFDFNDIPEEWRSLLYYTVLSNINREISHRRRERPRLIFIDEFRIMSKDPMLVKSVVEMFKGFRTLWAGVWVADQNPTSFTEGYDGRPNVEGTQIITNAAAIFALKLEPKEAEKLGEIAKLPPSHVAYLQQLTDRDHGRGLFISPSGNYRLQVELTQMERRLLIGT